MTESKFDYKKYKEINDKLCQLWQLRNIRDQRKELREELKEYVDAGMQDLPQETIDKYNHNFIARIWLILDSLYCAISSGVNDLDEEIAKLEQQKEQMQKEFMTKPE